MSGSNTHSRAATLRARATATTLRAAALVVALAFLAFSAVGCGSSGPKPAPSPSSSRGSMSSAPATVAPPTQGITRPPAPVFDTPRQAVDSYLAWVSFAYVMANSDVATAAFSPQEEVRVNSYVELNKQKNQRIDQRLKSIKTGAEVKQGKNVLLPAREVWTYRYLELNSAKALSPEYTATYDTTYTLIPRGGGGWIVDSVEANAIGEVK